MIQKRFRASMSKGYGTMRRSVATKLSFRRTLKPPICSVTVRQLMCSHRNGNERMLKDLIAGGSGNYVDKLLDMTDSIIASSLYYMTA